MFSLAPKRSVSGLRSRRPVSSIRRIERAIDSLGEFARLARQNGASELFGVATEALRSTANGHVVLSRIRDETRWNIEIISGDEEAQLTFAGLRSVTQRVGRSLLVDIGGGSTEFVLAIDRSFQTAESLAIGSGRLADRFFQFDPPGLEAVHHARDYALRVIGALSVNVLRDDGTLYLVGGNGLFLHSLSGYFGTGEKLDPSTLPDLCADIAGALSSELAAVLDIAFERAHVLLAGAGIALAVVEKLGPATIVATESGINRGLLVKRFGLD